jgi:hypothetical protein
MKLCEESVEKIIIEAQSRKVGIIFFDSLRAISVGDENSSESAQKMMDHFRVFVKQGITVVFTHHNKKKMFGVRSDNTEAARGSSAIVAAVNGHISLEERRDKSREYIVLEHLKSKATQKLNPIEIDIIRGVNDSLDQTIQFTYVGDHSSVAAAQTKASELMLTCLKEKEELLGRKDFKFLKCGKETTIKEITESWEKDDSLVKVMERREVAAKGMKTFSSGKQNEKLYILKEKLP